MFDHVTKSTEETRSILLERVWDLNHKKGICKVLSEIRHQHGEVFVDPMRCKDYVPEVMRRYAEMIEGRDEESCSALMGVYVLVSKWEVELTIEQLAEMEKCVEDVKRTIEERKRSTEEARSKLKEMCVHDMLLPKLHRLAFTDLYLPEQYGLEDVDEEMELPCLDGWSLLAEDLAHCGQTEELLKLVIASISHPNAKEVALRYSLAFERISGRKATVDEIIAAVDQGYVENCGYYDEL